MSVRRVHTSTKAQQSYWIQSILNQYQPGSACVAAANCLIYAHQISNCTELYSLVDTSHHQVPSIIPWNVKEKCWETMSFSLTSCPFSQLAIPSLLSASPRELTAVITSRISKQQGSFLCTFTTSYGVLRPDWIKWAGVPNISLLFYCMSRGRRDMGHWPNTLKWWSMLEYRVGI